ncbi:MAG TPA: hypothetical protein VKZ95_09525 [Sphingobacteriaceae bacterium]|nr:hypothetical protein [Sphingobacteriaceae bacterium]
MRSRENMTEETIEKINQIIADYFTANPALDWIPAKEIMPDLVKAGIFKKDEKSGLPLRKILRALDEQNALDKIPSVHPERIEKSTYWYLVKEGAQYIPKEIINPISKKQRAILNRKNSDESYIIDLCDELLDKKASRQHTFDFLVGDVHQDGRSRTQLPLDAYYLDLNLVIEYIEMQQIPDADADHDKQDKMTISGVRRAEQRKLYNRRKKEVLRKKQINLIEIKFTDFELDSQNKLVRNTEKDTKTLKKLLKKFIKLDA